DTRNRVFYKKIEGSNPEQTLAYGRGPEVVELLNDYDASYEFVGNDGETFWFQTDLEAPRGKVIAIDVGNPERSQWRTLIAEGEDTLQGVRVLNHQFVAIYMEDAKSAVRIHDLAGKFVRN